MLGPALAPTKAQAAAAGAAAAVSALAPQKAQVVSLASCFAKPEASPSQHVPSRHHYQGLLTLLVRGSTAGPRPRAGAKPPARLGDSPSAREPASAAK